MEGRAQLAWDPKPNIRHQPAHRFRPNAHAVTFAQLLARQRRPEIRVPLPDNGQRQVGKAWRKLTIAPTIAVARCQRGRTFMAISVHQSLNLPRRLGEVRISANRIKEAQLDLFGRRASCHKFQGNQLRMLLAGLSAT
jgi:hypothetical protein